MFSTTRSGLPRSGDLTTDGSDLGTESEASVLVGGLMTVGFGLMAVMAAIGLGWVVAAALGLALLGVARKVPVSAPARVLPYLLVGLGIASLLGAVFDFLV